MKPYLITIKAAGRSYTYGRYYRDAEKAAAMDTLEALFHLKLIDEFNIKEAKTNGVTISKTANVY